MDNAAIVRALLDHAGFAPSSAEVTGLELSYSAIHEMVTSLYAVEAVRYESPALISDPQPQFADWA